MKAARWPSPTRWWRSSESGSTRFRALGSAQATTGRSVKRRVLHAVTFEIGLCHAVPLIAVVRRGRGRTGDGHGAGGRFTRLHLRLQLGVRRGVRLPVSATGVRRCRRLDAPRRGVLTACAATHRPSGRVAHRLSSASISTRARAAHTPRSSASRSRRPGGPCRPGCKTNLASASPVARPLSWSLTRRGAGGAQFVARLRSGGVSCNSPWPHRRPPVGQHLQQGVAVHPGPVRVVKPALSCASALSLDEPAPAASSRCRRTNRPTLWNEAGDRASANGRRNRRCAPR